MPRWKTVKLNFSISDIIRISGLNNFDSNGPAAMVQKLARNAYFKNKEGIMC